jgi:hypothetical protein
MSPRWVLEGVWSGYDDRPRIVHRTVTTQPGRYRHLHWINLSDETTLKVRVRPLPATEQVQEIDGHTQLIDKAAAMKKANVTERELS